MAQLSDDFLEQVKLALEHLYDFPYLQRHALAAGDDPSRAGQRLRRELIDAIESLNPGSEFFFRSPHGRLYHLLHLHYVEALTIQESAHDLGISVRQAYRDLKRGQHNVAEVLWANRNAPSTETPAQELSSLQSEMARLLPELRPTDITTLVQSALHAVENLAAQHNLSLQVTMPRMPVIVSTNSVMARQVLINLLSYTVQVAQAGTMHIELRADEDDVSLHLNYTRQQNASPDSGPDSVTAQLASRLGWKFTQREGGDILLLVNNGPAILIIDDNEGLVQLLDRYLTGHSCRVIAAGSGQQGLELAHQSLPDAIVLDVMMPEMDGWELLQRLRNHPQTSDIPVIICTVFNDPELAYSLGASLFLPKPVSREDVMQALQKLGIN